MKSATHLIGSFNGHLRYDADISEVKNREMYKGIIEVKRQKSEIFDRIPFAVGKKMYEELKGQRNYIDICGTLESIPPNSGNKLPRECYLNVSEYMCIIPFDFGTESDNDYTNEIEIDGNVAYVGKTLGIGTEEEKITTRSISVYCGRGTIPCVLFRSTAMKDFRIGDHVKAKGYVKSRIIKKTGKEHIEVNIKADGFKLERRIE